MIFSLTREGETLQITSSLPAELKRYQVFPTVYNVTGSWGAIIIQILPAQDFTINYCRYLIKQESCFTIQSTRIETINLHFAYKNKFSYDTKGLGKADVDEGQFNLTYLPALQSTGHFTPGLYESFYISYSKKYLNRFVPYLPLLEKFLLEMDNNVTRRLHPTYTYASCEMMSAVSSILKYDHEGGLSKIFSECKALELLTHSVEKIGKEQNKKLVLKKADAQTFEAARTWLINNIDYSGTLTELAQQFHINEYKLKKGFKELYGCTVFEMLLKLRMERARQMLLETDLSVTEIGYRAGYSSGSHFSDAFRKHFGFAPNILRKK